MEQEFRLDLLLALRAFLIFSNRVFFGLDWEKIQPWFKKKSILIFFETLDPHFFQSTWSKVPRILTIIQGLKNAVVDSWISKNSFYFVFFSHKNRYFTNNLHIVRYWDYIRSNEISFWVPLWTWVKSNL